MDFQRDYILRMIQMMGDLMRRLAEKLEDRQRGRMLSDACREFCGLSLETGEQLDAASLREMLAPVPRFMLSELLAAKAETVSLPIGDMEELKLKALRLLASLHEEGQLCDLRAERLAALKTDVFSLLSATDLMDCARFFFQAEQYDQMEDSLFQALDMATGHEREGDRLEAIDLLRKASKAIENSLALCGMTSRELRESARELELETENHSTDVDDITHEQENPE